MRRRNLKGGVNSIDKSDSKISTVILGNWVISNIRPIDFSGFINKKTGIRQKFCFQVLLLLCYRDEMRTSKSELVHITNGLFISVDRAIDYLVDLGFARMIGKPRLIIPFNAYKIDKGYVITILGKLAVKKIIEKVIV